MLAGFPATFEARFTGSTNVEGTGLQERLCIIRQWGTSRYIFFDNPAMIYDVSFLGRVYIFTFHLITTDNSSVLSQGTPYKT